MTKTDWPAHIAAFRASSESAAAYCAAAGIKLSTFQYQLYKKNAKRRRHRPKRFTKI